MRRKTIHEFDESHVHIENERVGSGRMSIEVVHQLAIEDDETNLEDVE